MFMRSKGKLQPNISILPHISNIFEKIICRQVSNHFDNILSEFQCGFRKGYSPQHLIIIRQLISIKVFGEVFTDLSKAFNCICHGLFFAKLNAYGLSLPVFKLITDYLQNRKQRTKIG